MTAATPSAKLRRLKRRSEFLRAARGNRAGRSAFGMQVIASSEADPGVGFTVTKKVGTRPSATASSGVFARLRQRALMTFAPDMTMSSWPDEKPSAAPFPSWLPIFRGSLPDCMMHRRHPNEIRPMPATGTPDHER